jgi:hypothetical protein
VDHFRRQQAREGLGPLSFALADSKHLSTMQRTIDVTNAMLRQAGELA